MDLASIVGILSGIFLIFAAIFLGGDLTNFFNIPSIMIVFGGTIASTLLTFPLKDVVKAFRAGFFVLYERDINPNEMVKTIIKLSKISRKKGLISLSKIKTNYPILKKGCNLIADGAEEDIIRNALRIEIESLKHRHFKIQDVFVKMATFSPAFGMIGTLIGLVQMLNQLSDPSSIGPAMAIALLTTFYGVISSTLFFLPISGKLKARTMTEVINMEIIFEGAISILQNNNPLLVFERLASFIPPRERTLSDKEVYNL
ncbi:MAG TPA: MotA/TolQ/ExbB proton channel family protein [Desulfatiglandales bacterium]|nr:MotA/TolQ/ExbB proton channel family protein [Desulfatiglandales bacterium]